VPEDRQATESEGIVTTVQQTMATMREEDRALHDKIPQVHDAIWALQRAAIDGEGALDPKMRVLIGLAIAVSKQDEGCVVAIARDAASRGVSVAEVADALGVAILMNGGPGHIWGQHALAVFEECVGAPV
jgi:AhpD family alkylhydroperoxidase